MTGALARMSELFGPRPDNQETSVATSRKSWCPGASLRKQQNACADRH
jgi:hypothetical protein